MNGRRVFPSLLLGVFPAFVGCNVGSGEGLVESSQLTVKGCADGPFLLEPNFFGAQSSGDSITIRLQRGDLIEEASDGFILVVNGITSILGEDGGAGRLGESLKLGLPVGVRPPGVPIEADPDPAPVNAVLYLNDSCDDQNVAVYSLSGSVTFESLWSGDITEGDSEKRLIAGSFEGEFADQRALQTWNSGEIATSPLQGSFRFYFERGQPAQPFP